MRRLLGILLTVLCTIAAAILTWPGFFHLERTWPVAQLISFRTALALGFAAAFVIALLLLAVRPLRGIAASLAVVALLAAGLNGAVLLARGFGPGSLPAKGDGDVRVLTWNTAGSATPAQRIAQTAVAMDADVVALPETTIETGTAVALEMRRLGHPMWAHHARFPDPGWEASSTTLLISPRLGEYSVVDSTASGSDNTSVVPSVVAMPVNGQGPIIVAAHAVAPRREDMGSWRHDLRWLADQCAAADVIMAGDFNATVDHMARMGTGDGTLGRCRDAGSEAGIGAVGTWPTSLPALVGTPIDHVLATDAWTAVGGAVLTSMDGSGSDHRPVVVQLRPAG